MTEKMAWFPCSAVKNFAHYDVSEFKKRLPSIADAVWAKDQRRGSNIHFYDSTTLWLRKMPNRTPRLSNYGHGDTFHVFEDIDFGDTEFDALCRSFQADFESRFIGQLIRSSIIRLLPGEHIKKHIDGDENLHRYCHRLILPIMTNPLVVMDYDGPDDYPAKQYILDENVVYDTNGYVPHSVTNNSQQVRYAFVLDFLPNNSCNMQTKIYHEWNEDEWQKTSESGQRRILGPELKYPGIMTSMKWLDLYNSKKQNT